METSLLKFITCGSVDDGKSTLIGHMLYDAKLLFTDQEKALELDSKVGSNDGDIDYSLLLDGLMAEREQGITIDVAYRYFTTERRSFIVADTPGHEEYTRNMAVGASFADLAVILVDASRGVLIQTRRHARICALMGIRHFVFAINKMDLVDYSQSRFQEISKEITKLTAEFTPESITMIPVSATVGENVTIKSEKMPWYQGQALLGYLETIDVSRKSKGKGFCLPVQRVCRPNHEFRGFQGQVESGSIQVGDPVHVLPSGESSVVKQILVGDRDAEGCSEGQAVTVTLDDEIDVSRGSVLEADTTLVKRSMMGISLLWMDDHPLMEGRTFWLKLGTQELPATVLKIKYKIDVNTGEERNVEEIYKNELAVCEIATASPVIFDEFDHNHAMGSFILIDRVSNMTSACGVVRYAIDRKDNLVWQDLDITRELREGNMNQKAKTIWFTGLSGSGKSTVANALEKILFAEGIKTMLLDGDNVRMGLNRDLSFNKHDRVENIRRIAEVAKLMNDAGRVVLTSFISPFETDRLQAKEIIGDAFTEVYVSTSLEECERRDIKGHYKAARAGKIQDFTGISSPYEVPADPDVVIDTETMSAEECAMKIRDYIKGE